MSPATPSIDIHRLEKGGGIGCADVGSPVPRNLHPLHSALGNETKDCPAANPIARRHLVNTDELVLPSPSHPCEG